MLNSSYGLPVSVPKGTMLSSFDKSAFFNLTSVAAIFCSKYFLRLVPGIGKMPLLKIQASASWEGVIFFSAAKFSIALSNSIV